MSDPNDTGNSTPSAAPASSDPVTEAQADAAQAQTAADQALADPQADLSQLLDSLRTIQIQLFSLEVVDQVQQLTDPEKQAFVAARLHLGSVINQLNTAQLSQIADQLEQHSGELRTGIQSLEGSLNALTGAAGWAAAVNGIIGVIGQVIPLL